jgi:hypothetical protein
MKNSALPTTPDPEGGGLDPAATSHPMSPARPMSDEERAALEEVYRERGCGKECDG